MKNFKKLIAVIIAIIVVMSSMSTVLLGTLVSADTAALPSATVTDLTVAELLATNAPTLTFAKKFVADEAAEDTLTAYSSWYADFVLTVNKDVTFNANGNADGYLAGQYDEWSKNWVSVPFENVTLTAGTSLKIMEYAAELMNKAGLKFTYKEVYELVKEFKCGVFFDEEFLAANTDLEVTLELNIYNPEDETVSYTIHEKETFVPSKAIVYPDAPSATVTDIDIKELAQGNAPELTFAKKFVADAAADNTVDAYGAWYSDFVLTINKTVTFNANGTADGYLAGQYDVYSENWVAVPFEDVTLEANTPLNIMEYAAKMMGQDALNITYNDVLNFVKEFNCGVFFSEEFLAANPDVKVDLGLNIFSPVDKDIEYTVHEKEPFVLSDAIVYSDVNIDGAVDAADMTLVRKALIGTAVAESWYNVNVDNSFDVRDLVRVKKDAAEIKSTAVADADSLVNALENGENVILTDDITVSSTITVAADADTTINLNGNNISYAVSNSGAAAIINNKGTLNIVGEGTISFVAENPDLGEIPAYATNTITNTGSLTIGEGVTVTNGSNGGASYAVDNHGTFVLNGGTLIGNRCALRVAKYNQDNVSFVMNSGLIQARTPAWIQLPGSNSSVAPNISVTINGGTMQSTNTDSEEPDVMYTYSYGNSHANTSITINGGEFLGGIVSIGSGYKGDAPALTINGGTFEYNVLQWLEDGTSKVLYEANK